LDAINNVFRKFSAFHDETGRLNVDGMNIISNDGSNKLNRSRKARVSYKVQRTINASLNAATCKLFLILKSGVNHTSRGSISTSTLPSIKLRKCSSKIITSILSFISGRLATKSNQIKQLIRNGRS